MPPSRANAKVSLETDASRAKPDAKAIMIKPLVIAVAAAFEPVAAWKIAMMGNPVGVLSTSSIFPRQKSSAMRKPNASNPLMQIVRMMTFGMVVAESLT